MNSPLSSPCPDVSFQRKPHTPAARPRRVCGFTLVEMLTATAILSLLFVMLGGILGTMSRTWKEGQQRANNYTKARAMLDLLARDLQGGLYRSDLVAFPSGSVLFYTQRPGITASTARDISLVEYKISTTSTVSMLQRGDVGYDWSASSSSAIRFSNAQLPTPSYRDTAPGIVGFKLLFIYASGLMTTAYPSPSATPTQPDPVNAIGISIAVVDDQALTQLVSAGKVETLRGALSGVITGNRSVKSDWDDYLQSGLNWGDYPKSLASGLKIFERYVYLPTTN